jgi:hypothetical protein
MGTVLAIFSAVAGFASANQSILATIGFVGAATWSYVSKHKVAWDMLVGLAALAIALVVADSIAPLLGRLVAFPLIAAVIAMLGAFASDRLGSAGLTAIQEAIADVEEVAKPATPNPAPAQPVAPSPAKPPAPTPAQPVAPAPTPAAPAKPAGS